MKIVTTTSIGAYPLVARGKVRDIYEIDESTLLIVTTDRMSAFDVVLPEPVPFKGIILNQLTLFWMEKFQDIVPNHVLESHVDNFPLALKPWKDELAGRSVIARAARPLPVECIVRGYLAGSAWSSYEKTGEVCGYTLEKGLKEADRIIPAIFTPSTKAARGAHDENITVAQMAALTGDAVAERAKLLSLDIYAAGSQHASQNGMIMADTKFEFGFINDTLHLIDEVLTPDSSRFWAKSSWSPGKPQPSFDKQYLRDWLNTQNWNHEPPPPHLPEKVIEETVARYREAYEMLTGQSFSDISKNF